MLRIPTLLAAALLLLSVGLIAQENPKIKGDELVSKSPNRSLAKKELKLAEKYYSKGVGTYDEALNYYLKLYAYNPDVAALNYKIGICYLMTSNKQKALGYLEQSKPEVAGDYYLALGKAFQYNLKFDDAKASFDTYLKSLPPRERNRQNDNVQQLIKECEFSGGLVRDSLPVFIINLGPLINSYYDDYGAVLGKNDSLIYFTSRRPDSEPSNVISRYKYKERVLVSNNCIHTPSIAVNMLDGVRKNQNLSLAGINKNADALYFYRGKRGNGNSWYSVNKNGKWSRLNPVGGHLNHIAAKETSIAVADDGTAYFVSDRRGGKGGKDIYQCRQIEPNKFGKPTNLGFVINTPFDEEGVSVSPDGKTLYFSSKGHAGMGGFDVYKSTKQPDNSWGEPVNMGYPINSAADELFYHATPDSMIALYATVREGGYGGLDIYQIKKDPRIPFTFASRVTDVKTGKLLPATVSVYDLTTSVLLTTVQQDTLKELVDDWLRRPRVLSIAGGCPRICNRYRYAQLPQNTTCRSAQGLSAYADETSIYHLGRCKRCQNRISYTGRAVVAHRRARLNGVCASGFECRNRQLLVFVGR
jgi:tetratricopeptide (TPR) repeat protein